jgi:hypothetical protein
MRLISRLYPGQHGPHKILSRDWFEAYLRIVSSLILDIDQEILQL